MFDAMIKAQQMLKNAPSPIDDKIFIVNIDDLLSVLHGMKKKGYKVQRQHDRAIWYVYGELHHYRWLVTTLYIDVTRTIGRGTLVEFAKPKAEWMLKFDR